MMALVAAIAQLNLSSAMVRFVPTAGARTLRLVAGAFIVSGGLAVLVGLAAVVAVRLVSPGTEYLSGILPMAMFVIATALYALFVVQNGVFVGLHRAGLVPLQNVVFAIVKLLLVVALAAALPFHGIFASWVLALGVVVLAGGVYLFGWAIPRHERANHADLLPPARQIGRFVAFDYFGSVFSIGTIDLMPIMVIAVLGAEQNAYYAMAWVIAYTLHLLNTNMGTSLVAETASSPDRLSHSVRHVLVHTGKLIVPLVALTIVTAPLLLSIFGAGYGAATTTLQLLALAAIPHLLVSTALSSARAQRRLGFLLSIQLTQCIMGLSLSWLLLHIFGLAGAGLAWLITQTLVAGALLLRRHQWLTVGAGDHVAAPVRSLPARLPTAVVLSVLQLLTRLRLRGPFDRLVARLRSGRADRSRSADALASSLIAECSETVECTTAESVRTVSDVAVAVLRPLNGEPTAVLKLARTPFGASEMRRQRLVLDQFAADPRLSELRPLLPRVLAFRDTPEESMSIETIRPGVDLADLLVRLPRQTEELTTAALATIARLHHPTGTVDVVNDSHLRSWVDEPLATLSEVCHRMDPRLAPAVDNIGNLLRSALEKRKVLVSWTHGDFTPDNIRLDEANRSVTGIFDWGGARPGQLSILDGYLLTLGVSRLIEGRELGALVQRRLRAGGLVLRERRPLQNVQHTAGTIPPECDTVDERAAILLTWLHHASDMWRKCGTYREHRIWWAGNIAPVLRVVVASSLLNLAVPTIARPGRTRALSTAAEPGELTTQGAQPVRIASSPSVAVVICAYTEDRWDDITAAVDSVQNQSQPPDEIVLVIDYCPALLTRATREFPDVTVIENDGRKGLSGARNAGITAATADIVAFLDDDAVAAPDWVATLAAPYADPDVLGVGGRVLPNWRAGRPSWFPTEFDWVVGCSYRGMPTERSPIRNFIGANMSLRRRVLVESGGFHTDLGRIGTRPLGCEETELCIRVQREHPQGVHLYEPTAQVRHSVPRARGTWSYYRSRCFAEGLSKAVVSRLATAEHALATERSYLKSTIPRGFGRYVGHAFRGRPSAIVAAMALTVGVVITGLGYAVGHARLPRTPMGPAEVLRRLSRVATATALPVAITLWLVSLPRIRLDLIGDYGLVPLLPLSFWAALVLLLLSYAVLVRRGTARSWVLSAHLISLVAFLHATPAAIYGTLRYSWAWKHVGVTDFFLRHSGIDGSIRELGVYQRWPGFFTLNATMVKGAGLQTALDYAPWAPLVFNLLLLGPLYLIYRTFTTDRRLVWTGMVIYVLTAWVGQDYFAPQPTVYFLFLTIIALCVRYRAPAGRGDPSDPRGGKLVTAAVVLMIAAIVPTHQLTPPWSCSPLRTGTVPISGENASTGSGPARGRMGSAVRLAVALGESARVHRPDRCGGRQRQLRIHQPLRCHCQPGHGGKDRSRPVRGVGVLAIFGFARRVRRYREPVLVLLAIAPMTLILTNDYGGEMIFGVYLFALPFAAFYARPRSFPGLRRGGRGGPELLCRSYC